MHQSKRVRLVTWSEVQRWTDNLGQQMVEGRFAPEVIIGITRGGWVPATLLSDWFQIIDLHTIKIEHHGIARTRSGRAILTEPLYIHLYDKRVLVLDDISNTGQSLALAVDKVKETGPREVRTAALMVDRRCKVPVDYFYLIFDPGEWDRVIFPWDFFEHLAPLVQDELKEKQSVHHLQNSLATRYEMNVGESEILSTLDWLRSKGRVQNQGGMWWQAPDANERDDG